MESASWGASTALLSRHRFWFKPVAGELEAGVAVSHGLHPNTVHHQSRE